MKFTESASKEIRKIMERDGLDPDNMAVRWELKVVDVQDLHIH